MRSYLLLSIFALAGLTSGCASITGSTTQNVSVQSREHTGGDLPGAVCELSNSKGRWFVTTPGSVMIHRSNDDMQVLCSKAGYEAGRSSVVSVTKGEMFGNIILGGVIGAVIDHNNGSGYEYPEFIQVLMRALSRQEAPPPATQAAAPAAALPAVTATPAQAVSGQEPARQAPRHERDPNPQVGDTWTYRYSDGYGRTETYKVRLTVSSNETIEDEIRSGKGRQALMFGAGLELVTRTTAGLTVREFSPYLQSLGPVEFSAGWQGLKLFEESKPFQARFIGTEIVNVPAGNFEAKKLLIEGTQFARTSHVAALSREYKVTVWYAPAARRFVKMAISAPARGMMSSSLPAERDVIELLETNFALSSDKPVISGDKDPALTRAAR